MKDILTPILQEWQTILAFFSIPVGWFFKNFYDKIEIKKKTNNAVLDNLEALDKKLDFYKRVMEETELEHQRVLKRKDREIERIRKRQKKSISELQAHRMFLVCREVIKKVEEIELTTHGEKDVVKTRLMKILINEKIDTITRSFLKLIQEDRIETFSSNFLKNKISKMLFDLINEYNKNCHDVYLSLGISAEHSKFLLQSYEEWRSDMVEGFTDSVDDICVNDDYSSNYDKLSAIFELVAISMHLIPKDVKGALNQVNGLFTEYNKSEMFID